MGNASGRPAAADAAISYGRAHIFHEALALLEYRRLLTDPILAGAGVADGRGCPVLVIPGFLAPDLAVKTLVGWLRRTGYHAAYPHIGPNMRCGEPTVRRLERRLETLAERQGERVVVIGHSRGGQFARVLGVRRPDLVRTVITLATPRMDVGTIHPLVYVSVRALSALRRFGVAGVMGPGCLSGACCEELRADAIAPLPVGVSLVCVVARLDGFVDRHACADTAAQTVVTVKASHIGTTLNPETYRAIAAALVRSGASDVDGSDGRLAAAG
jgi:pimeloyl-ACP methyl ester carboxylesterase